jgi:hypothetical protein
MLGITNLCSIILYWTFFVFYNKAACMLLAYIVKYIEPDVVIYTDLSNRYLVSYLGNLWEVPMEGSHIYIYIYIYIYISPSKIWNISETFLSLSFSVYYWNQYAIRSYTTDAVGKASLNKWFVMVCTMSIFKRLGEKAHINTTTMMSFER